MSTEPSEYNAAKGGEEHIIKLPDGRQLAYARNGPLRAKTVIIFFSGLMAVGTAYNVPEPCKKRGALWLAPTPIGMGNTSSRDPKEPYYKTLARDTTALLDSLYGEEEFDELYVAGGSYGTVMAQMLYGAPYDIFPAGRKLVGCMLMAGFSPIKYDGDYAQNLSWQSWMSIGPPSQMPFRMLQRVFRAVVGSKMKTVEGAKEFLRATIWGMMDENEKKEMHKWLQKTGGTEDEFFQRQAESAVKSGKNWDGFMEVADVLREDWGFVPGQIPQLQGEEENEEDEREGGSKRLLVVGSEDDQIGGSGVAWMAKTYKGARLKMVPGGHISTLYGVDEFWTEMFDWETE